MDATVFTQSLQELMVTFHKRMDSFEGKLQKTPAATSTDTLAAEFAAFKLFVMTSMRALQGQIELLAKENDQLEMRSRRKILLIHGLPEASKEVPAEVVAKVVTGQLKQTTFAVVDIIRCHRMGRAGSSDRPRPILCEFRDTVVRAKIWSAKACLKGTGITISEFLTKTRHSIFMAARQRFGIANCWTREGFVFVLAADGTRHRISCQGDLDGITEKDPPKLKKVPEPAPVAQKLKRATSKK